MPRPILPEIHRTGKQGLVHIMERNETAGRELDSSAELSMGWVDLWVGLGWVHCSKSTENLI